MCEAIGVDIAVQELDQAQKLFKNAADAKAAVAVLRFVLMHAAKYDIERTDLVEELQQLGMQQVAAEAIAQSYEDLRARIQDQQRTQRFQFPGVESVEWKVKAPSKVILNLKLDQPVMECNVATTATPESRELHLNMSKNKLLALYEELSQAQSLLHSV
ncbi:HCaRG [Phytophthora cactorum]|nr:HCaRG [Phytophthora cactorum]